VTPRNDGPVTPEAPLTPSVTALAERLLRGRPELALLIGWNHDAYEVDVLYTRWVEGTRDVAHAHGASLAVALAEALTDALSQDLAGDE
jgi:hypothetical protein